MIHTSWGIVWSFWNHCILVEILDELWRPWLWQPAQENTVLSPKTDPLGH
jgi:hypothetical protein